MSIGKLQSRRGVSAESSKLLLSRVHSSVGRGYCVCSGNKRRSPEQRDPYGAVPTVFRPSKQY